MGQPDFVRGDEVELPPLAKPAEPDVTFDERYLIECGGRRLELISVPGGETIDSLVVWLPDDGVALVGNMFSALFGHFPNLVTMRGDRMRSALAFVDSVQTVIDLDAEMLLLGHHGPVRGAATVRAECERIRDATLYVHDATVAAMNDGKDVWTAMREITLPEHLEVGEAYGRIDWSVRAIWESYAGWYHQHSTLDLYGAAPEFGAEQIVDLAGGTDAVAGTRPDPRLDRRPRGGATVRARARDRRRASRRTRRHTGVHTSSCSPNTGGRTSGSRVGSKARSAARRTASRLPRSGVTGQA